MARSHPAPGESILAWWRRLSSLPGGQRLFSVMIGQMAPYTATIGARIDHLSPGHARWILHDRRRVRNHLDSIHAVALVNLGEVTSGTAMLTALPPGVRGIVTALRIAYLKKARGTLTAECRCTVPDLVADLSLEVVAEIRDAAGDEVARCTVTWLLSPGRDRSAASQQRGG